MKIIGNDIFIVRGNTFSTTIHVRYSDGTSKKLDPLLHELTFTVKKNPHDEKPVISRKLNLSGGSGRLYITREDTANLQHGVYYYDIELKDKEQQGNTQIITIIPKSKFVIEEEITTIK